MSDKYFVVAGNRDQYLNFIKRKTAELWNQGYTSVTLSHFVYATPDSLRGCRNPGGWFIGTWYERPDAEEILKQLFAQTTSGFKFKILQDQMTFLLSKK